MEDTDLLRAALQEADAQSTAKMDSAATAPCPASRPLAAIRVVVVGEDDAPLPGIVVELVDAARRVLRQTTARDGACQIDGLEPGQYSLSLCELDSEAWEVVETVVMASPTAPMAPASNWQDRPSAPPGQGHRQRVGMGMCLAKIAYRFGFFPETIWRHPENAALRQKRADLHILAADDEVYIPAPHRREVKASTGTAVMLRRRGVPERLRIRFLDRHGAPRAGLPFVLFVELPDGDICPARDGVTDPDGILDLPVSPAASSGTLRLDPDGCNETYEFDFAYLDPIEETSGVQARLNNLGYGCGDADGVLGPLTRAALRRFQADEGLPPTGDADPLSLQRLVAREFC